jgi:hypothetical protein
MVFKEDIIRAAARLATKTDADYAFKRSVLNLLHLDISQRNKQVNLAKKTCDSFLEVSEKRVKELNKLLAEVVNVQNFGAAAEYSAAKKTFAKERRIAFRRKRVLDMILKIKE